MSDTKLNIILFLMIALFFIVNLFAYVTLQGRIEKNSQLFNAQYQEIMKAIWGSVQSVYEGNAQVIQEFRDSFKEKNLIPIGRNSLLIVEDEEGLEVEFRE